jgi:hypothetical protein
MPHTVSVPAATCVRECCRRLAAICDVLNAVGWSKDEEPTDDVDATAHASVVKEVTRR